MPAPRPFALVRTHDQWQRVSHSNTALEGEVVLLKWLDNKARGEAADKPIPTPAGLAFDSNCRLYHSLPEPGSVERLLWAAMDPLRPVATQPTPVHIIEPAEAAELGDFVFADKKPIDALVPRDLVVDPDDRLFVADQSANQILIYDIWSNRLLRQVQLGAKPLDLAIVGRTVYALLESPAALVRLDAHSEAQRLALPAEITAASRLATSPSGEMYLIERAGTIDARIVKIKLEAGLIRISDPANAVEVEFATDLEFQTGDPLLTSVCTSESSVLVVARRSGEDFRRFCVGPDKPAELPPLTARRYDGRGIVRVPDGRIGFWTDHGFRHAVAARQVYVSSGEVTTFRLDSGDFQTTWGRVFVDACIPKHTQILIRCLTTDDMPVDEPPAPLPPSNTEGKSKNDDFPLPPATLEKQLVIAPAQLLHRRETGRELPWIRLAEDDRFETYEAPVLAAAGRYLWVRFELSGDTRTTPRFRALRAEYPSHDYLRRIPKAFSRDDRVASFLRRYLATFEGVLGELEAKADARAMLLDPRSAPGEILPWLASFLGLTLDERMARAPRPGGRVEDVRRQLIEEVTWLFRFRGTIAGLRRFIEIYLGTEIILIEKFRMRGLGGALLGDPSGLTSSSIVGAGLRVGGAIGSDTSELIAGSVDDGFETNAHRFSIMIPAVLSTEQHDVIMQILELHRPAHTLVDVCTAETGMRVGKGLQVEISSIIGRAAGFTELQLGGSYLGRGSIVGRPQSGTAIGGGRLGQDSRVG